MCLISIFGRIDTGTGSLHNRTNGGGSDKGRVFSEDHKQKIREALLGKKLSKERRSKISKSQRGIPKGPQTMQHIENAAKPKRGRPFSDEHKQKLSKAKLGKKLPPFSDEHKRKLSESNKRRFQNDI